MNEVNIPPTFNQVFIKRDPDTNTTPNSTSSLLSINSPVLQKNSPKSFIIREAIERSIEENFVVNHLAISIKTEPIEDSNTIDVDTVVKYQTLITEQTKSSILKNDWPNPNEANIEDEIQEKKRQIVENETTVYRCQQCGMVFQKFLEYKLHKTEHSIEKRTCKICHILFQGTVKLNEHMNIHKGIKPFKCSKCKKSFVSAHTLKCHMECHRAENSFHCEKCGKGFKTKRSLRGHLDITHAKKIKDYICKICNEEFDFSTEYRRHLAKHGATPPQPKCSICEAVFKYESQLKTHLGTHKELKFPCEYCSKIFSSMTKIRKHVKRTHVINECEICKKVFYDKTEFGKHKKTEHIEDFQGIY